MCTLKQALSNVINGMYQEPHHNVYHDTKNKNWLRVCTKNHNVDPINNNNEGVY